MRLPYKKSTPTFTHIFFVILILFYGRYGFSKSPESNIDRIDIEAESIFYDWNENILILEGSVLVKSGQDTLAADKAVFYRDKNLLELFGDVSLKFKEDLLQANYAKIDTLKKIGIVEDARLFLKENNIRLTGSLIERTGEDTYKIRECKVTSCDGIPPAWHLYGSSVEVTVDGYGKVWNASLRAKEFPLLYTPFMVFPAKTSRQSGILIPRVGYSKHIGMDLEVPFFWNLSQDKDFTFYQRYMGKKGYLQGIEFRYVYTRLSRGAFMLDIMREDAPKALEGENLNISPLPRSNLTRFWFRGSLDQELPFQMLLNSDLDLVSDQDFLRELQPKTASVKYRPDLSEYFKRPFDERYSPFRSNIIKISKGFEDKAYAQFTSEFFQIPERPGLDLTPQPVFNMFGAKEFRFWNYNLLLDLEGTHRYVYREEGEKGHLFKLTPNLKAAIPLMEHFTLSPLIKYKLNWWEYTGTKDSTQVDLEKAFETALGLSTSLYRDYQMDLYGISLMRHNIIPRVELKYTHGGSLVPYPWFDESQRTAEGKKIHLRLENNLTGKIGGNTFGFRRLGSFIIDQELVLNPGPMDKAGKGELGIMNLAWILEPKGGVEFRGDLKWNHKDSQMEAAHFKAAFPFKGFGGKEDSFSMGFESQTGSLRTLNLDLSLNIPYGMSVTTHLSRDLKGNENVNSSYTFAYKHQCYGIKLVLDTSQRSTQVGVFVELLGLGELGGKF